MNDIKRKYHARYHSIDDHTRQDLARVWEYIDEATSHIKCGEDPYVTGRIREAMALLASYVVRLEDR